VVVVAALALAGCDPTPYTFTYVGTGTRVAVVGDSITAHAEVELLAALEGTSRAVGGVPSMTMVAALEDRVRPAIASGPDVVVVEYGLNDALDGWDRTDLPGLEAILALLDTAPCVVWVTPSALSPSYFDHLGPGLMQTRARGMRNSLLRRLPQHPNQRLADWSATQLLHPEWFLPDHLHHSPAGHAAYAQFVAESIDLCA
jgi:lysophospholipase L1-like esterase